MMTIESEIDYELIFPMEIVHQIIGSMDVDDGVDQYVLITRKDDTLTEQQAHDWLLPRIYIEIVTVLVNTTAPRFEH